MITLNETRKAFIEESQKNIIRGLISFMDNNDEMPEEELHEKLSDLYRAQIIGMVTSMKIFTDQWSDDDKDDESPEPKYSKKDFPGMDHLSIAKKIIEEEAEYNCCGIFDCHGYDRTDLLYEDGTFQVCACYGYCYLDVVGLTASEFEEAKSYYEEVRSNELEMSI